MFVNRYLPYSAKNYALAQSAKAEPSKPLLVTLGPTRVLSDRSMYLYRLVFARNALLKRCVSNYGKIASGGEGLANKRLDVLSDLLPNSVLVPLMFNLERSTAGDFAVLFQNQMNCYFVSELVPLRGVGFKPRPQNRIVVPCLFYMHICPPGGRVH